MTVHVLARALEAAFVSDTRTNGDTFYKLRDGSPEWMSDAIHASHGDMGPDDWRYAAIRAVAGEIAESDDYDDESSERIDSLVDVYTSALTGWLASRNDRYSYVDDAMADYGPPESIINALQLGQSAEYQEIWSALVAFLSTFADECNCDESSWHGAEHQSACPLAGLARDA